MGIAESKLTSKILDQELVIGGYNFIRMDRKTEGGGGGCLLCYKDNICLNESPAFASEKDDTEKIWADINFHSQHLALALMYRPPKHLSFYEKLDKQLQHI